MGNTHSANRQHHVRALLMVHTFQVGHAGAPLSSPCQRDANAWLAPPLELRANRVRRCTTHNTAERFHTTISIRPLMHVVYTAVMAGVDTYNCVQAMGVTGREADSSRGRAGRGAAFCTSTASTITNNNTRQAMSIEIRLPITKHAYVILLCDSPLLVENKRHQSRLSTRDFCPG